MVVLYDAGGRRQNRQPNVKDLPPSIAYCRPATRGAHVRTWHRPDELLGVDASFKIYGLGVCSDFAAIC